MADVRALDVNSITTNKLYEVSYYETIPLCIRHVIEAVASFFCLKWVIDRNLLAYRENEVVRITKELNNQEQQSTAGKVGTVPEVLDLQKPQENDPSEGDSPKEDSEDYPLLPSDQSITPPLVDHSPKSSDLSPKSHTLPQEEDQLSTCDTAELLGSEHDIHLPPSSPIRDIENDYQVRGFYAQFEIDDTPYQVGWGDDVIVDDDPEDSEPDTHRFPIDLTNVNQVFTQLIAHAGKAHEENFFVAIPNPVSDQLRVYEFTWDKKARPRQRHAEIAHEDGITEAKIRVFYRLKGEKQERSERRLYEIEFKGFMTV